MLRARGFRVTLKPNIGSSEIVDKTLLGGTIDLYPEYTGVVVGVLQGSTARLRSAREAYARAKAFEAGRGMEMLQHSPFSDALAVAVTPATARRYRLRTVGDLRRLGPFRFGGAPENRTRFQGLVGMRQAYGLTNARYLTIPLGTQYRALDSGRAHAVNVLTTDGQLREDRYVVLADPKGIFGYQNVAPVVRRGVLDREGPRFARTLNTVTRLLTQRAMQQMNGAVDIDHRRPAAVAREFLRAHGLL